MYDADYRAGTDRHFATLIDNRGLSVEVVTYTAVYGLLVSAAWRAAGAFIDAERALQFDLCQKNYGLPSAASNIVLRLISPLEAATGVYRSCTDQAAVMLRHMMVIDQAHIQRASWLCQCRTDLTAGRCYPPAPSSHANSI